MELTLPLLCCRVLALVPNGMFIKNIPQEIPFRHGFGLQHVGFPSQREPLCRKCCPRWPC